jgi:hypothetical protein
MHRFIRSSINKWSRNIFFERFIFLHSIYRCLLYLWRTQLIRHHRYRSFLLVSRNYFLLVEITHMTKRRGTSIMLRSHHLHTSTLLDAFGHTRSVVVWNSLVYGVWANVLTLALENLALIWCIH